MHKQVFLSRDATALDFPVVALAGEKPSQVESIIAVETKFGRAIVANRIPASDAEICQRSPLLRADPRGAPSPV
jgi:hypothetical protein